MLPWRRRICCVVAGAGAGAGALSTPLRHPARGLEAVCFQYLLLAGARSISFFPPGGTFILTALLRTHGFTEGAAEHPEVLFIGQELHGEMARSVTGLRDVWIDNKEGEGGARIIVG